MANEIIKVCDEVDVKLADLLLRPDVTKDISNHPNSRTANMLIVSNARLLAQKLEDLSRNGQ